MNQLCQYSYPFPHYNPCPRQMVNTCNHMVAPNDGKEHFGQVYAKTLANNIFTIKFEEEYNTTILDIKKILGNKENMNIPVEDIRLYKNSIFWPIALSDKETLGYYGIKDNDIIRVMLNAKKIDNWKGK